MRITNDVIAEREKIKAMMKKLEKRIKEIDSSIKESGGVQTKDFSAVLEDRSRVQVAGYETFEEKMGHGWLEKNGLVETMKFKVIVVARRDKK